MRGVRKHLTYANVVSTLAVFLILGGATAAAAKKIGAKQLKAGSVTAAKLKRNAVTTRKIRNGAVTGAKIADGAVDGAKIADGSLTGADIDASSQPFSRVVAKLRGTSQIPATVGLVYPLDNATYIQPAGRTDEWVAAIDVTFAASCTPPRTVAAYLLANAANPTLPDSADIAGTTVVNDSSGGAASRRGGFVTSFGAAQSLRKDPPAVDESQTASILVASALCTAGSGITINGVTIDVIGTR